MRNHGNVEGVNVSGKGMSPLLTVSRSRAGDTVVVSAVGEIDITSASQLRDELEEVAGEGFVPVIDLSGVEFMGSVGLSVLLAASEQADPQRVRVVVSPQVRRPIEVTGLDKVLGLFDTLDDALSAG